jgi:hypothetical protein
MIEVALGPVPCQGCRQPVRWTGSRWSSGRGRHMCPAKPVKPLLCGAWMPVARQRCVRLAGHKQDPLKGGSHQSADALEHARLAKSGRRVS